MGRSMANNERVQIRKVIGGRVRRRRKIMGLTLVQLAELVGCQMQQVQKYETGANEIGAVRLYELAEALDVDVQYFFEPLQNDHADDESGLNEASVIKAARSISKLPLHVQDRIRLLAEDAAEALYDSSNDSD